MPRVKRGLVGETFTSKELDVLASALDEFEQARRYAGKLSNGDDRKAKLAEAGVASRLLARVQVEEGKLGG